MRILLFLLLPLFSLAQSDVSVYGNVGAFGVVLDTFNAPVGPGAELGVQISNGGFIGHGALRRGYVGSEAEITSYNLIQAGLGGTHSVFFFSLSADYLMIAKQGENKSNGGAIGASLRVGADIPISERFGIFGVFNLGVNRLHTYTYAGIGASYHFPFDMTAKPESFFK